MTLRPDTYRLHNGEKATAQFSTIEYETRLAGLRAIMAAAGVKAAIFTSMHSIAYYSGFLYCAFGRPYGLVVTATENVTISAGIDAGQPWRRSFGDNITYTDWQRDNFWRAIRSVAGENSAIGYEGDHLTLDQHGKLVAFLSPSSQTDLSTAVMQQRMHKSPAELALIREGARIADIGGYAIRDAVKLGSAKLILPWPDVTRWNLPLPRPFPMPNIAIAGFGFNLGSTPMARIIQSPAGNCKKVIFCRSTAFQ